MGKHYLGSANNTSSVSKYMSKEIMIYFANIALILKVNVCGISIVFKYKNCAPRCLWEQDDKCLSYEGNIQSCLRQS